ncbi:MAG: leucine-rich repeat domain-containing protein [Eubacterium sp.]|nr:leucine-rich repeat domain-containing protein [Eubacterium sp.]
MKKAISTILAAVMIISSVICVDLSALATEVNISNRAEWLSELTQLFEMTVEEDNYPDNYFSDLTDESPYYRDILVAAEFGLVDVEAGDPVDPEGDITREFASQTLNFCLKWELEKDDDFEYSFADWQSCAYPDDDQVAVDHSWLTLDESSNFNPEQKVTTSEIETMLADAQKTLKGDEIDENYDSTFEYNDGVIEVSADTEVDFNDNEVVIHSTNYDIKQGDTFVVYSNGIPVVYTATKVTDNGDSLTIKTSEDVDEEAVESVDMQTAFDVDASDFIPAEGYEVVGDSSANSLLKGGKSKPKTSIKLAKKIYLAGGNSVNVEISISDIKLSAKQITDQKVFEAKASCKLGISFDAQFNFTDITNDLDDELGDLGTIPVAGIGYFEFKPEINFQGKAELKQTYNIVLGYTKDEDGMHNISSFSKEKFTYTLEGSCKIGVKIGVGIKIVTAKAGIYADIGVLSKASVQATTTASGKYTQCVTLSAHLYFKVGAELKIDLLLWKATAKVEWEIYKESNSPIRLYFHLENGKMVDKCCTGSQKYVSPSGTKYGGISGTDTYYGNYAELTYSVSNDEVTITGYTGSPTKVLIPSKIDGYPVTAIGEQAFLGCSSLTSINIPNGVTSICVSAFNSCSSLTSVNIPNSVTSIGEHAFWGCSSLTSIDIPNSVTSIGAEAFYICSSLSSITVASGNPYYDSRDNCNAIIETATSTLIIGCNNTIIPTNVTSIGEGAFYRCTSLTSINIPNSVTYIGNDAFASCSSLTSVSIGNGITSIGRFAFASCYNLKNINLPNSVNNIGWYAFSMCRSLESVVLPKNLKYMNENTFNSCISLVSVVLPEHLEYIREGAFAGCKSLTSIDIPNSVTYIGDTAFSMCRSLKSFVMPDSVNTVGRAIFYGCTSLQSCVLSNNIDGLDSDGGFGVARAGFFEDCKSLETITIPNSVKFIGARAFMGCSSLTSICLSENITKLEYNTFENCINLKSITLPNSVTSIGSDAFANCTNLESVFISKNVSDIAGNSFYKCENLSSIIVDSENSVYDSRDNCNALIETSTNRLITGSLNTVIPDGITTIDSGAFFNLKKLTSINIPCSVTIIEGHAFGNTNLKSVYYTGSKEDWDKIQIDNYHGDLGKDNEPLLNATIYYNYSNHSHIFENNICTVCGINEYSYNLSDSNIATITNYYGNATSLTLPSTIDGYTVKYIGSSAFAYNNYLNSVTVPTGYTLVNSYAFINCKNLYDISLPSTITAMGGNTIYGTEYYNDSSHWQNGVLYIGEYAVASNSNIYGELSIKSGTKLICTACFSARTNITSVAIPKSVKYIRNNAFNNCTSIEQIILNSKNCSIYNSATVFPASAKITGYHNSTAESYATNYSRTFDPIHEWDNENVETIAPTCENEGYNLTHCKYCDKTLKSEFVDALGHHYNDVLTKPNCTDKGYTTHICTRCGKSYKDTYVDALGHHYNAVETYPTCTDGGYTTYTCDECGYSYIGDKTPADGHIWGEEVLTKEPTITSTGVYTYYCIVCGKTRTETIAKLPKKKNPLVAKGKTVTVKYAKLKKKNQTVLKKDAFKISNAKGKVSFKKSSGNKKIAVNSAGKITVKKGLKKGKYTIKVKVTAAGNATYKKITKTVTVTIRVK